MIKLLKRIFGWSKKEEPLCPVLPETEARKNKTVSKITSKKKSKKAKKKSSKKNK